MKKLDRDKFKYLSQPPFWDESPKLVLACKMSWDFDPNYQFKEDRQFIPIAHQTAGHMCNQHFMYGTILTPRDTIRSIMEKIANHWLDSDCGCFGVSFNELLIYRKQLQEWLGLDCNSSYRDFEEGIYPIDCSAQALEKLQVDDLPNNLDDLIVWKDNFSRACGCIGRWSIFILGENCD